MCISPAVFYTGYFILSVSSDSRRLEQLPLEVAPTALVIFSPFCDLELSPMRLTFEHDLDSVKLNWQAKNIGQRSSSKVIVRTLGHTYIQTHTPDQLLYLDH